MKNWWKETPVIWLAPLGSYAKLTNVPSHTHEVNFYILCFLK